MRLHRFRHQGLLGTVVEVVVHGPRSRRAGRLDALVVAEIERLERIFTVFDPASELSRWRRGSLTRPSEELAEVLVLAAHWQVRSDGAFNPAAGVVSARWVRAAAEGQLPGDEELARLAADIARPRITVDGDGRPVLDGDGSQLNLHALAKGWIVDRALARAVAAEPTTTVVVNAGGDMAVRGPGAEVVGIEHPLRPYDNVAPLCRIALRDAGLATSGRSRRGFRVGERWFSHVIDPRTARPADHLASISVVAPSSAEADVMATVAGLMGAAEAVAWADGQQVALLAVDPDGRRWSNRAWDALEARVPQPERPGGAFSPG